jgi:hypothetical protein
MGGDALGGGSNRHDPSDTPPLASCPGMPYTVQLYLLPVMGAPLRVLCLVSVPLHTMRATVTILLGHLSDDLTAGRIVAIGAYYLVIVAACTLALRRLRRSLAGAEKENETGGG